MVLSNKLLNISLLLTFLTLITPPSTSEYESHSVLLNKNKHLSLREISGSTRKPKYNSSPANQTKSISNSKGRSFTSKPYDPKPDLTITLNEEENVRFTTLSHKIKQVQNHTTPKTNVHSSVSTERPKIKDNKKSLNVKGQILSTQQDGSDSQEQTSKFKGRGGTTKRPSTTNEYWPERHKLNDLQKGRKDPNYPHTLKGRSTKRPYFKGDWMEQHMQNELEKYRHISTTKRPSIKEYREEQKKQKELEKAQKKQKELEKAQKKKQKELEKAQKKKQKELEKAQKKKQKEQEKARKEQNQAAKGQRTSTSTERPTDKEEQISDKIDDPIEDEAPPAESEDKKVEEQNQKPHDNKKALVPDDESGENLEEKIQESKKVTSIGHECFKALEFLEKIEPVTSEECHKSELSLYNYETNVTDEGEEESSIAESELNNYQQTIQQQIMTQFPHWRNYTACPDLQRQLKLLAREGPGKMDITRNEEMNKLKSEMLGAYADTTICQYKSTDEKCTLHLDPDISRLIKESSDYDEQYYYWKSWHDKISEAISAQTFADWAALRNERAVANGFKETYDEWADEYEDGSPHWCGEHLRAQVLEIWETLRPHYLKMHAFVRMKLKENYGARINNTEGYIPAHILGNMWAEEWDGVEELARPFPNAHSFDVTKAMKEKKFTVEDMYHQADHFFQSLGLYPMNIGFWENSMLTKPSDNRDVICDPTAFDMCLRSHRGTTGDYRIKMCPEVNQFFFEAIHHEMGHIQYYMQYSNLPYPFRNGANPAFHEAIGDALSIAVTTPKHLHCIMGFDLGFPVDCHSSEPAEITEADINHLFRRSLNTLAYLPSALSLEEWRWEIFTGRLKVEEYNNRWWAIRKKNQGIVPDQPRPPNAFDPAGKFHVVEGSGYIRYFISVLLQFQFFQGMCVAAKEYDPDDRRTKPKPLYQCDFSNSKDAGWALSQMMQLGASKPWPEALKVITGSSRLSVEPLLNYFEPLLEKITQDLEAANEKACFGHNCVPPTGKLRSAVKKLIIHYAAEPE